MHPQDSNLRAFASVKRPALYFHKRVSEAQITLPNPNTTASDLPTATRPAPGRLLALDLGAKRIGVAISDELRLTVRPLPLLHRTNWKELLRAVAELGENFDAQELVIGLPLDMDGAENAATREARRLAHNFELSLKVPVHLQDERLTSHFAELSLRQDNIAQDKLKERVDSAAAVLILKDFLSIRER
ncbi:MAG: Holliday junction resolvase RuvX [Pyrinomonadaceae bacterium]|jgi:putative Holliday junction resolvase|nr:Holliday junction resolvase RuvX [Pyrinomonadaceae bacterium]